MNMTQNKTNRRSQIAWTMTVLFLVFSLIVAFLFALNGRYEKIDDEYYFDKWTRTILEITKYKEV